MAERLRALKDGSYPEPNSLELLRSAGGRSKLKLKLTAEQRKRVRIRQVKAGEWCDDLPKQCVEHLIAKGRVERVQVEEEPVSVLTRDTKLKAHRGEKVHIALPIKKKGEVT